MLNKIELWWRKLLVTQQKAFLVYAESQLEWYKIHDEDKYYKWVNIIFITKNKIKANQKRINAIRKRL